MDEDDPRGALVYAAATRTLDQQQALLENIQGRSGILLSAASIVTSFLAALAIREEGRLTLLGLLAVAAFVGVVALCVLLLTPRGRWTFRFDARALVRNCLDAEPSIPLTKMHRDLSIQMDQWAESNEAKLDRMLKSFRWADAILGVEVVLWIADLSWRR